MGGSSWFGPARDENDQSVSVSLRKNYSFSSVVRAMTPAGQQGPRVEAIAAMNELLQGDDISALVAAASGDEKTTEVYPLLR